MHLILARQPLLEALRLAEPLLPPRSPEPLLEHVLLRAESVGCTLLACEREVSLCLPVAADVRRPGAALVPGRRLAALLRQVEAGAVELRADAAAVRLGAPGLTCRLPTADPAHFPHPAPLPARADALLPAGPLAAALRRTLFAAAPGPGCCRHYLLEAVLCEAGAGGLRLVASD